MTLHAKAMSAGSEHERGGAPSFSIGSRRALVDRATLGLCLAGLVSAALLAVASPAPAARPDVETTGSLVRTATTALLEGRVNPKGGATSYHFEFGSAGPCDSSPCDESSPIAAGEGETLVLVADRVTGLTPGTTYHYRAVADNGNHAEVAYGQNMTVTTRQGDPALSHGLFPGPPNSDRAWEQVNAPDTGGHTVNELKGVSRDGDRVLYNVKGGTPTASFGGIFTPLVASRSSTGWTSQGITGSQKEEPGVFKTWAYIAAANDLSGFVGKSERTLGSSLWRLFPGAESALLPSPESSTSDDVVTFAISEDGSRIVMRKSGEGENLYGVSSGTAILVSRLPDESIPTCGSRDFTGGAYGMPDAPLAEENWVSADGSLVFFPSQGNDCSGPTQLYVRNILDDSTRLLSPPPISGESCGAAFIKSTAKAAYFWSVSRLTADDPGSPAFCGESEGDVYRYELSDDTLSCLTCGLSGPAEVQLNVFQKSAGITAVAVAEDDSRIYFKSSNSLVEGAPPMGLYRLKPETEDLRYIAPGEGTFIGERPASYEAMTPDGSVVAFRSFEAAINPIGGQTNGETGQYYVYDDRKLALTCATCPQDGSLPTARATLSAAEGGAFLTALENIAMGPNLTPLSEDGTIFAFSTPTPLSPLDTNTVKGTQSPVSGTDAYEWRDGQLLLVSDGLTNWPESFESAPGAPKIAGVSASGKDIYFTAAARLTPDATETAPRLYDARVGGGFTFPAEPQPCPLEVCQGTPAPPPAQPVPGSSVFDGPANPVPKKHKKKHKKKKNKKGKNKQGKRGKGDSQVAKKERNSR